LVGARGSAFLFGPPGAGRSHPLPWLRAKSFADPHFSILAGQYDPNYGVVGDLCLTPSPLVGEGWGEG